MAAALPRADLVGAGHAPPEASTPEQRLVMCMLAAERARPVWGNPNALAERISWDRFLEAAIENTRPYLHWASEQPPFQSLVPSWIRAQLAAARDSARLRNLRWTAELRQIGAAFRGRNLRWLPVKGATLQRTVYPDPSTRPMSDVDLVVRREDMPAACILMLDLGFLRRTSMESQSPAPGTDAYDETHFYKQVGKSTLLVEMHTRLDTSDDGSANASATFWSEITEVETSDGLLLPVLEPNAALRHLCLHLAKHAFEGGLMWLLDIRLFLERYAESIDWDRVFRGGVRDEASSIALAIGLASDWLGAEAPHDSSQPLTPDDWQRAAELAWDQMTDPPRSRKPPNVAIAALSGSPRRIWKYVTDHLRSWTAPVPGVNANVLALMGKRFWSDLRILRASFRDGGFGFASVRSAARSDRRAAQLRSILGRSSHQ